MPPRRSSQPSVSETVREAIAESGLSAYALGQLAGISRQVVCDFQARKTSLTLDSLDKIAPHVGIKVHYPARKARPPAKGLRGKPAAAIAATEEPSGSAD